MSDVRSQSGDRYEDTPSQETAVPHRRSSAWEDSIRATSQAICGKWGSDGGMDEWSSDCNRPQHQPAAGNRNNRRRMSDTGRMSQWSKSTQSTDKLERLLHSNDVFSSFYNNDNNKIKLCSVEHGVCPILLTVHVPDYDSTARQFCCCSH